MERRELSRPLRITALVGLLTLASCGGKNVAEEPAPEYDRIYDVIPLREKVDHSPVGPYSVPMDAWEKEQMSKTWG